MGGSAASSQTDDCHSVDVADTVDQGVPYNIERVQEAVQTLICGIGEDIDREGLRDTPKVIADTSGLAFCLCRMSTSH